jgi:hypothetical protein
MEVSWASHLLLGSTASAPMAMVFVSSALLGTVSVYTL